MDIINIIIAIILGLLYGCASAFRQHPMETPPILRSEVSNIIAALSPIIFIVSVGINTHSIWNAVMAFVIVAISAFIANFKTQYGINKEYQRAANRHKNAD